MALIKSFKYNWYAYSNEEEYGADSSYITTENDAVVCIYYHEPSGDGDAHYCDTYYHDGSRSRKFNINQVQHFNTKERLMFDSEELAVYMYEADRQ